MCLGKRETRTSELNVHMCYFGGVSALFFVCSSSASLALISHTANHLY